jgi:hypothetical protein
MVAHPDKTLAARLGMKEGSHATVFGAPRTMISRLRAECPEAKIESKPLAGIYQSRPSSFLWCFCEAQAELKRALPALCRILEDGGVLWISWPKKSSWKSLGLDADKALTEDFVREQAKSLGLADMKTCAVDEVWSAIGFHEASMSRQLA